MPQEDVLIRFITAANLAGVDALKKSFLGLNVETAALATGLFLALEVGKSADENYRAQLAASDSLTQAYETQNDTLAAHRAEIEAWLTSNRQYIRDQYDAQQAIALFVRAGNDQVQAMRMVNDALDLSVIRHESVSESAKQLELAIAGNSKTLREFGITTEQYNAIMQNKTIPIEERHAALLTLIEQKTAKARETTDQATKSELARTNAYRDFTEKIGPLVVATEDKLNEAATTGIGILTVELDLLDRLTHLSPGSLPEIAQLLTYMVNPAQAVSNAVFSGTGPNNPGNFRTVAHGSVPHPTSTTPTNITIHVSGAHDPSTTARAIAKQLRNL